LAEKIFTLQYFIDDPVKPLNNLEASHRNSTIYAVSLTIRIYMLPYTWDTSMPTTNHGGVVTEQIVLDPSFNKYSAITTFLRSLTNLHILRLTQPLASISLPQANPIYFQSALFNHPSIQHVTIKSTNVNSSSTFHHQILTAGVYGITIETTPPQ
jgi:hypothetical protein